MSEDLEKLGAEALAKQDEEDTEVEIEVEFDSSEEEEDIEVEEEKKINMDEFYDGLPEDIESTTIKDPEPTPEEAEAIVAQKKARIAQVMTRGITNEKLQIVYDKCVPDGYSGKFVLDDEGYVIRYTNLGFGFTYTEGASGVHGRADGRIAVGDVVLMTITLADREILKTVKHEKMLRNISAGKDEYKRRSEKHADEGGPSPIDLAPA